MNRTINLSVLNYLVQKLEHRARCVNKTKTKCTEHENALIKEFAAFLGEIEEDLKQAASVIMNLINENKKYENICLNKTIKETSDNINRTLSELKKSTRSNKTDEEKEKSKLHLQLYDKQHMIKMKNKIDYFNPMIVVVGILAFLAMGYIGSFNYRFEDPLKLEVI